PPPPSSTLFPYTTLFRSMLAFAKKFGYGDQLVGKQADGTTKIKVIKDKSGWDEPEPESLLREINRTCWTIGYTGQSPERLKLHIDRKSTRLNSSHDQISY